MTQNVINDLKGLDDMRRSLVDMRDKFINSMCYRAAIENKVDIEDISHEFEYANRKMYICITNLMRDVVASDKQPQE